VSPSQILQRKLIQHEPCIHTLTKLESDIELLKQRSTLQEHEVQNLKQTCDRKDLTIGILKQHRNWQECEIARLKKECKEKDIAIEGLNSEKAIDSTESKAIEMPKLLSQNSRKQVELDQLVKSSSVNTLDQIKQELTRLRLENRDVIRLQAKLCKLELKDGEYERMKVENLSQRQELNRLERKLQKLEGCSAEISSRK